MATVIEMSTRASGQGVDQQHEDFVRMEPWLTLVDDLRQGTARMRQQHETYLPSFTKEDNKNYARRWGQATLYPAFEETVGMLTGKAFAKPPELDEEDVPPQILGTDAESGLAENIDLQGNHFQVFAENFFKRALRSGLCHLLVDSTPYPAGASTAAEKQQAGHRPYWVLYEAKQVFAWRYKIEGGRPVLTQVRISETVEEEEGEFASEKVEQIRVLEIGRYRIFREIEDTWVEIPEGQEGGGGPMNGYDGKPLTYIPLVTLYTDEDNGFMTAIPQLLDLAYQNVRHFQKQSDYDNCMSIACFPIFCASGIPSDEQGDIALGPFTICKSTSPESKYYFAEHSGAALAAARQDLQDLKEDMAMHGLKMLMPKPGATPTATATAITEASTTSQLQVAVLRLKDCLELALGYTAEWLGLGKDAGGSVLVDIKNVTLTAADVEQILKAAGAPQQKVIDVETAIEELKRRGFLDEGVDAVDVIAKLQNQSLQHMELGALSGSFLKESEEPVGSSKTTGPNKGVPPTKTKSK